MNCAIDAGVMNCPSAALEAGRRVGATSRLRESALATNEGGVSEGRLERLEGPIVGMGSCATWR